MEERYLCDFFTNCIDTLPFSMQNWNACHHPHHIAHPFHSRRVVPNTFNVMQKKSVNLWCAQKPTTRNVVRITIEKTRSENCEVNKIYGFMGLAVCAANCGRTDETEKRFSQIELIFFVCAVENVWSNVTHWIDGSAECRLFLLINNNCCCVSHPYDRSDVHSLLEVQRSNWRKKRFQISVDDI